VGIGSKWISTAHGVADGNRLKPDSTCCHLRPIHLLPTARKIIKIEYLAADEVAADECSQVVPNQHELSHFLDLLPYT
jgi:hypothetical protein